MHNDDREKIPLTHADIGARTVFSPYRPAGSATLFRDVGGMDALKELARIKIVTPFKRPELFKKFKKQAGGGILLYGPPGCGKTFLAKAIAGECGAAFFNVGIDDILDMYVGNSERNVAGLFDAARAQRPAVLFIDEIDALGRRRDLTRHSAATSVANTFLSEMDGLASSNESILVLGATNAIWDVDAAFKRPGRFDRVLFAPPPDRPGREAILRLALEGMPVAALDLARLAERTDFFSGADLKALVDRAAESVLDEIVRMGEERLLEQEDLEDALRDMRPSTLEWLEIAKNYVEYANESGLYNELKRYLEQTATTTKRLGFGR